MSAQTLWIFMPAKHGEAITARLYDAAGELVTRGPIEACLSEQPSRSIAVVPGVNVALIKLAVPAGTPAQMQTTARLLMRDDVATKPNHLTAVAQSADGGERWAAHFDAQVCADVLTALAQHGVDPDVVTPAALLLPDPAQGSTRSSYGPIDIARTSTRGFAAEAEIMDLILADQQPMETLADDVIPAHAARMAPAALLNLRVGQFAKRSAALVSQRWFKRAGVLTALAAALWPAMPLIEAYIYRREIDQLDARVAARVAAALPNAPRIVNARAQLDERLAALGLTGSGDQLYGALISAMQAAPNAAVEQLSYDQSAGLSARLIIADQRRLDPVVARLRAQNLSVDASEIRSTGSGPRASITIRPR
ncbi:MAG: type II secretion system protein GspL [Pseudomonadota bacterium]